MNECQQYLVQKCIYSLIRDVCFIFSDIIHATSFFVGCDFLPKLVSFFLKLVSVCLPSVNKSTCNSFLFIWCGLHSILYFQPDGEPYLQLYWEEKARKFKVIVWVFSKIWIPKGFKFKTENVNCLAIRYTMCNFNFGQLISSIKKVIQLGMWKLKVWLFMINNLMGVSRILL